MNGALVALITLFPQLLLWCETHSKHFTPKQVIKFARCFKFYLNVIQQKNKFEVVDTDDEQTVSHGQVQGVENEMN